MDNSLIIIGGIYHFGFAIFHMFFWRLFQWKKDLASLTVINRSVMQILNLCLTFVFLVIAYISIFYADDLISTNLGKIILISISAFWVIRTIEQLLFFGLKKIFSKILTVLFVAGVIIYIVPVL